ncbi:MAG TPA: DNA polymerase III subunit gamma/tau, partial [Tepidisphaeraceae bacterium]|nr:DNA polymerase III subunit gamma/tau [Tepidisphaeraceae bacterium]
MSYTVLARRYRSNNFDQLVGQDHVAQTLKKAIESGRLAHAYLFCGTRGTGKTSTARILAKALNCQKTKKPTPEPCGECESCKAIARGEDMDVIEIDAASNTGVDNIREVIENSQYRPAHSRFKIYIIDEVHMLSKSAFNALLKTLEEPPEHVKFILATTEPEKVLPTILSRCQRYDFRNISTREIAEHLKGICKQEKIGADEEALFLVAKAGAGSMRDALSLLDRLLSLDEKKLTVDLIEQMLGMPKTSLVFDLVEAIGSGDVKATLEQAEKMIDGGLSADVMIGALVDHLRNLLILRTCGAESRLVEVPGMPVGDLVKQAGKFEPTILSQDIAILEELRRTLRQIQSGRALLDATLVRLALAEQFVPIGQVVERGEAPPMQKKNGDEPQRSALTGMRSMGVSPMASAQEHGRDSQGASSTETATIDDDSDDDLPQPGRVWDGPKLQLDIPAKPSVEEPKVDPSDLPGVWRATLKRLAEHGQSIHAMLSRASFKGITDDCAILEYTTHDETFAKRLEQNGKKDLVRQELSQLLARPIGLRVLVVEGESVEPSVAPAAPAAGPTRLTAEVRQRLADDPWIKAMMDEFGGEI